MLRKVHKIHIKEKTLFEMKRDPNEARAKVHIEDDNQRSIQYMFPPEFFMMKTIGTSLVFGTGAKPVKDLKMIEKFQIIKHIGIFFWINLSPLMNSLSHFAYLKASIHGSQFMIYQN
jgi:GMP-PDE, delta subunit